MLNVYIDESYVENGNYYVGALVVEPETGSLIRNDLDAICARVEQQHGSPTSAELHGYALFHMKDDWVCLSTKPKVVIGIYNAVLRSITNNGGRLFFRGVDTVRQRETYRKVWPPHVVALQFVLEEVHKYALSVGKRVKVIADQVQDQHHHESRIQLFQSVGTMGYKSTDLSTIDMPFEWADSKLHRNLQAVDMATFLYRRVATHAETNAQTAKAVQRLYTTMVPAIKHAHTWVPTPKPSIYGSMG